MNALGLYSLIIETTLGKSFLFIIENIRGMHRIPWKKIQEVKE